jgi:hypothetical protein
LVLYAKRRTERIKPILKSLSGICLEGISSDYNTQTSDLTIQLADATAGLVLVLCIGFFLSEIAAKCPVLILG